MNILSRFFACSALCLVALPAVASFDMHLIPSGGQIRRYDPDSNVGLGGVNIPGTNNLTLDQANNRMLVSDTASDSIRAYNYNTGAALGAWSVGAQVQQMAYHAGTNSIFYATTGGALSRLRLGDGTIQSLIVPVGVTPRTVSVVGTAFVAAGTNASSQIVHMAFDPVTGNSTDTFSVGGLTTLPGTTLGKALTTVNGNGTLTSRFTYRDSVGGLRVSSFGLASNGFFSSASFAPVISGYASALMPSVARGHNGYFLIGSDATLTNTLRVEEYSNFGVLLRQNTLGGYTFNPTNFGADNVVAPEPGTLAALAIGAATLVRKRRQRLR